MVVMVCSSDLGAAVVASRRNVLRIADPSRDRFQSTFICP